MDFDISDSNKISKAIHFIFGIFSYVSKKTQKPTLTTLEVFPSVGKWQDFYQQNARSKVRNLNTNSHISICFLCGLGLCV